MTYDEHIDCDRQLNEAEDRILMLNKVIEDLNGRIKELEAENDRMRGCAGCRDCEIATCEQALKGG